MAVTNVTPTRLVAGTFSATLPVSGGVTATSQTDGWSIALGSQGFAGQLIVIILDDGSGATLTVKKGDSNAPLAAKGDVTKVIGASETLWFTPESGRHEQDDNTINIVSDDAGTKCIAFLMPVGRLGGSGIA